MGEGLLVRKGGGGVGERTAVPSINFISSTTTSLTFTFTNNDEFEVELYYGIDENPPTTEITLAANTTTSNITFSELNDTDTFDIYAYAIVTDPLSKKIKSEIVETQAQTLIPTPTITNVSQDVTAIGDASITFTVTNNSRLTGDVIFDLISPPVETTLQLNANTTSSNQTISGLQDDETFTIFAQTKITGFADSAIASQSVQTPQFKLFTAATGGITEEYDSGDKRFRSHTFTSNGTFQVTAVGDNDDDRNKVDYLIIAGGAGGGGAFGDSQRSGGGGAGGYRTTNGTTGGGGITETKFVVNEQSFSIGVGGGGAGNTNANSRGANGGGSSAFAISTTGGGGGGGGNNANGGANGGSGGGGGRSQFGGALAARPGGLGTANQGFDGQNGPGIGGGAGSAGVSNGNGLNNLLRTGSNQNRASGGRRGTFLLNANGYPIANNGANGAANTGRGGGGAAGGIHSASGKGGNGGSGIVIIRYEIATV